MKLKRIIACILAASVISVNAYAYTEIPPFSGSDDGQEEEQQEQDRQEEQDGEESQSTKPGSLTSIRPRDYQYKLFKQILDLYVQDHLYDFTEEDVFYKFFYDFLADNPQYFEYMVDYILGTMDPYSAYHSAYSGFLEGDTEQKGFGFTIKNRDGGVYIEEVLPATAAEDAGFMPGDKFVEIEGIDVENQAYDVVTSILASPSKYAITEEGTEKPADTEEGNADGSTDGEGAQEAEQAEKYSITVDRNGERITFELSKAAMTITPISSSVAENNGKPTAYIAITNFLGDDMDEEFTKLIKKYADDGIKYLTIDLRDNGGGSLDYALSMAELFIENGDLICYYNDKTLEEPTPIYSTNDKISFNSITILVNENTASAAELFASILRDKGLAKIIGAKTYGKSLGQSVYTLATGDYITITTYQILDSKLESYDGVGIIPDLSIEDVEMCYTLPELGIFNHQNFVEIKEGVYSDVTKALEDRMVIMGLLREEYCDGIFDDITKTALYVFQKDCKIEATGYVNYDTVSKITRVINSYKTVTYLDDTQYDVAMIVHHSFSQGKRLVNEKERLREKEALKIEERDAALDAAYDAANGNK